MSARNEEMMKLYEMYDPANPYALGRHEYNDRYERLAKNAAYWRRIAFAMLLLLTISTVVVLWMAQSIQVVPFIVQVDQHGFQIAVQAAVAANVTDDRIIMARIADFVENYRSVFNDRVASVSMIRRAYDSVSSGSPAQRNMDEHFRTNNPLTGNSTVNITVHSVIRAAPESNVTWQVEWTEILFNQGQFVREVHYRGMFEIEINSPTSIRDIMRNPLGIFIRDFHITERLS